MVERKRRGAKVNEKKYTATERTEIRFDLRCAEERDEALSRILEIIRMPNDDLDVVLDIVEGSVTEELTKHGLSFSEFSIPDPQKPTFLSWKDFSSIVKVPGYEHDSDIGYAVQILYRINAVREARRFGEHSRAIRAAFDLGAVLTEMRLKDDADVGASQRMGGRDTAEKRNQGVPDKHARILAEYEKAFAQRLPREKKETIDAKVAAKFGMKASSVRDIRLRAGFRSRG